MTDKRDMTDDECFIDRIAVAISVLLEERGHGEKCEAFEKVYREWRHAKRERGADV